MRNKRLEGRGADESIFTLLPSKWGKWEKGRRELKKKKESDEMNINYYYYYFTACRDYGKSGVKRES